MFYDRFISITAADQTKQNQKFIQDRKTPIDSTHMNCKPLMP